MHRPGVELAIFQSLVRRRTTALPSQPQGRGRGLCTLMQADYVNFVFKFTNFRYHYWGKLHCAVTFTDPEQPLGYLVKNRGRICYTKVELWRIFCQIFIFSLPWQQGSSEQSLTDTIKLADSRCKHLGRISCTSWVIANFVLKIANFRCHEGYVQAKCEWHSCIRRPRKPYHGTKNYDSIFYTTGVMAV